jgi:hypothetical protein
MVSATVYLFTVPSLSILVKTGMADYATDSPSYATAVHAAALTFQYESLKQRASIFLAF